MAFFMILYLNIELMDSYKLSLNRVKYFQPFIIVKNIYVNACNLPTVDVVFFATALSLNLNAKLSSSLSLIETKYVFYPGCQFY